MSRVLVVTDVHQFESKVHDLIELYSVDHVLDCGDHDDDFYVTEKPVPWYMIKGNHEDFDAYERLVREPYNNIFPIVPGDYVEIDGVNIAGFGGNYSQKTYNGTGKKYSPKPGHITPEDFDDLKRTRNKRNMDILLMHESSKELWEETDYPFGQEINSQAISVFPNLQYVISGHYHVPAQIEKGRTTQISLNTPEDHNFILFEFEKGRIDLLDMSNNPSANPMAFED